MSHKFQKPDLEPSISHAFQPNLTQVSELLPTIHFDAMQYFMKIEIVEWEQFYALDRVFVLVSLIWILVYKIKYTSV